MLTLVGLLIISPADPGLCQEEAGINPLAAHFSEKYTDDLNGLLEKRYIRVLKTFNRTGFFLSDSGMLLIFV
jgi:hypothetical protein